MLLILLLTLSKTLWIAKDGFNKTTNVTNEDYVYASNWVFTFKDSKTIDFEFMIDIVSDDKWHRIEQIKVNNFPIREVMKLINETSFQNLFKQWSNYSSKQNWYMKFLN